MGSIASSQAFGNALSSLQGVTGQLVTNAQGQIIGTIPLMPNPGPSSQAASGTQGLQVQPITPQLLTNAQGQIIATVIGNQILPVINTQGITLSPIKPGQQPWLSWNLMCKLDLLEHMQIQLPLLGSRCAPPYPAPLPSSTLLLFV
ncbi:rCG45297, isoform CRA_c [Rattus norvegicus]|uniref:RCG45297, isoform CRA_c n=1 Tax=Rattus norvegicus TaxID=10116 RepID=A6K994_RAT|nr:rCG45297, isoform CRA_c [Rattus norvegicus]